MKADVSEQEQRERAGIDARCSFAFAAFAAGLGILLVLDRIGLPDSLVRALSAVFVLVGLAITVVPLRTMRISRFYGGGRSMPPLYAGLAFAGLAAGLFLPFLPPVPDGPPLPTLAGGFGSGFAAAALLTGPLLRRTGAFSIPDLLTARFPNLALRLGSVLLAASIALLVLLAGFATALNGLTTFTGLSGQTASFVLAILVLFVIVPGGLSGVVWAATGSASIALVGLGLPILNLMMRGEVLPLPVIGSADAWRSAFERIHLWSAAPTHSSSLDAILILALTLGLAALAPLLMPAIACRDRAEAQKGGFAALVWMGILVVLTVATLSLAALAFDKATIGQHPDHLPDSIYAASRHGGVFICGTKSGDATAATRACARQTGFPGTLSGTDIVPQGQFLIGGFAALTEFSAVMGCLADLAMVTLGIAVAAAGAQSFATALAHDGIYHVTDSAALTSRRLALARGFALLGVGFAACVLAVAPLDPGRLIALALALSASTFVPLMALSLWRRATAFDAMLTFLVGLATAELVIMTAPSELGLERFAASAILAATLGLATGLAASFLHPGETPDGQAFVKAVLSGQGELLHPDKGA